MSLADQSQQWFPTSVQVTVHQGRNLRAKGKNGTNDAYAIIQVAKDKFSTSVAEKTTDPVWKEEASFDLPLFHPGNTERCTLYVTVMHRAQVGLDKFLGQAVVNLLQLHDNKSRQKQEWFKLVDKAGKEDKDRGEVLLNIQLLRNNLSASMFDLSMQDKPRSRISKLKDKVRGKKKDGYSDSASAIVPSVSQVLTDSEGEADARSLNSAPEKKKSKLKKLFGPKSNLQRNVSQSMSTLGTLPEKNSSLSGSRSSGLNVDTPEAKKKFKFLGHKRTGSSDSKGSLGPFSLLGRSKQNNSDLNAVCINGSHVYAEETEPKSGSTLSLNTSLEDIKQTSDFTASSIVPSPSFSTEYADKAFQEQQHHLEEEQRRRAESRRLEEEETIKAEAKRLQEEEERSQQEELERKRRFLEQEALRKKQEEEDEKRRQNEERRMLEAAENQRLEEERRRMEEQKHQEEASMSDRLSSLFGIIRKKEEKKEEQSSNDLDQPAPNHTSNPFVDISLSSDTSTSFDESPAAIHKSNRDQQTPSATVFLNRSAKVSAVKPRLPQSLDSPPTDSQIPIQRCSSPDNSDSTLSSVPAESPETFSTLHSSLAPSYIGEALSGSPQGHTETLKSEEFVESWNLSSTMAEQKRRAPLPPLYSIPEVRNGQNAGLVKEIKNPAYVEAEDMKQNKNISVPLPDYETLFPQKRHGVQGQTKWDHLIAEVNQRNMDLPPELLGPEMSVDDPKQDRQGAKSSISQEISELKPYQTHPQDSRSVLSKKGPAPGPPKPERILLPQTDSVSSSTQNFSHQSDVTLNRSAVLSPGRSDPKKMLDNLSAPASYTPRLPNQGTSEITLSADQNLPGGINKNTPTARARQKVSSEEVMSTNGNIQTLPVSSRSSREEIYGLAEFDPFPSSDLLSKDPWEQQKQNQSVESHSTPNALKEQKLEDRGMTPDDLDKIFSQEKPSDPFASINLSESSKQSPYSHKDDVSKQISAAFQRKNSQRGKKTPPSTPLIDSKTSLSQRESTTKETLSARDSTNSSFRLPSQTNDYKQSKTSEGEDPFGAKPFTASSEPQSHVTEEPASQMGNLARGKTPLQAPHAVKPLSSAQHPTSSPAVKGIKVQDFKSGMMKVPNLTDTGPYSQLTQEELITLVVKQQTDLSVKHAKIAELEEYIDNLLVRVIEEQPGILNSLTAGKPV
ncbi:rab11 family-interacting protein 1 isoform X2 [Gouania willdenowi]|uniref:Rab11 family-interacting protein 1-like n=1 Tax=Gouania willdenowi TaxID=441366 RepID=A0A8C5HW44_GOUWI|nr:rab11 family-interacting protein 1-like isoform X2 [Gouania willdenowi]